MKVRLNTPTDMRRNALRLLTPYGAALQAYRLHAFFLPPLADVSLATLPGGVDC